MVKLSDCEEKVLKVIWECENEPDLGTTMRIMNEKHNQKWKPQTVSTFLARLVRKGYVTGRRQGRYTYYKPTISLEEYRRQRIMEMVELLYDGDAESAKADLG